MDIKQTFLNLTNKTYPYGYETLLENYLPSGIKMDEDGNYFYEIGKSNSIFACHLDTACAQHTDVVHVFDGDIIRTNGKTVLGADDKAGVVVLLYMIKHNIPGLYYFFVGEEVGCIGSSAASKRVNFFRKYNKIISFDRRGTCSVITHQSSQRCCSDSFALSLANELNKNGTKLELDQGGVYTDSAEFTSIIPECTNISVGYYKEHTVNEHQDITYLELLCNSVIKVNWENLPISRDPNTREYKRSGYYQSATESDWEEYYNSRYGKKEKSPRKRRKRKGSKHWEIINNDNIRSGNAYYNDLNTRVRNNKVLSNSELYDYGLSNNTNGVLNISHNTNYYSTLKEMLFDAELTEADMEILKFQYLNMDDESDYEFYRSQVRSLRSKDKFDERRENGKYNENYIS